MSNRFSKLAGWSVAVLAVFVYTAQPFPPPCNGKIPANPTTCAEAVACPTVGSCPPFRVTPSTIRTSCDDGANTDHCVDKPFESTGPCKDQHTCAVKRACEPIQPSGCHVDLSTAFYVCTNAAWKTTSSCTAP